MQKALSLSLHYIGVNTFVTILLHLYYVFVLSQSREKEKKANNNM